MKCWPTTNVFIVLGDYNTGESLVFLFFLQILSIRIEFSLSQVLPRYFPESKVEFQGGSWYKHLKMLVVCQEQDDVHRSVGRIRAFVLIIRIFLSITL